MPEVTLFQLLAQPQTKLTTALPKSYKTYRDMRKQPTLAINREFAMAPVIAGEWSYEGDDDTPEEWIKFIQKQCDKQRRTYVANALRGCIDFGWAPFEVVYEPVEGKIVIAKVKPLLQDITSILVDTTTGAFVGFEQFEKSIPLEICLLVTFGLEGTQWYGNSLLENARVTYNEWMEANAGAARYDRKMAGTNFVVYYPYGTTLFNGTETDNFEIAKSIISALESSGSIAIPSVIANFVDKLHAAEPAWKVDYVGDGNPRQYSFVARLEYLDKLMSRSMIVPERAVLEASSGTRADASSHQDLASAFWDIQHELITDTFNKGPVNTLLALNFGPNAIDKVRAKASPILNATKAFMQDLYKSVLTSQSGIEEFVTIDTDAMKDELGIPKRTQIALAVPDVKVTNGIEAGTPPGESAE